MNPLPAPRSFPPHPRKLPELLLFSIRSPGAELRRYIPHFWPALSHPLRVPPVSAHRPQPCAGPIGILSIGGKCQSFHPWNSLSWSGERCRPVPREHLAHPSKTGRWRSLRRTGRLWRGRGQQWALCSKVPTSSGLGAGQEMCGGETSSRRILGDWREDEPRLRRT